MAAFAPQRRRASLTEAERPNTPARTRVQALCLLLCLIAFALRLFRLGAESLWYDETVSAYLAREPLSSMFRHTALDIHPPGYYLLLHMWASAAGASEYALSFFSLFFGVLLVALLGHAGRRLCGEVPALWAVGAAALSAFGIWYSQEVRMYTLAACLGCLLALETSTALRSERQLRHALLWGFISAACLYTLYYLGFLVAAMSLAWLWHAISTWRKRRATQSLASWSIGQIVFVALYLPWMPVAVRQAVEPPVPAWRSHEPLLRMLASGASALAAGEASPPALALAGVAFAVIAASAILARPAERAAAAVVAASWVVPFVALCLASLVTPLFHPRYLFPFSGGFLLSLASAAERIRRRVSEAFVLLALSYAACNAISQWRAWYHPNYRPDDLRGAIKQLQREWVPGDVILLNAGYIYTAFSYYWQGSIAWMGRLPLYQGQESLRGPVVLLTGSLAGPPSLGHGRPEADFYRTTIAEEETALEAAMRHNRRLWQLRLYDTVTDPMGELRAYLQRQFLLVGDFPIPGPSFARLQAFAPRLEALPCPCPVTWGGQTLRSCAEAAWPAGPEHRGVLDIHIQLGEGVQLLDLRYTVRALAPSGAILWQRDGPLAGEPLLSQGVQEGTIIPLRIPLDPGVVSSACISLGFYTVGDGGIVDLPPSPTCEELQLQAPAQVLVRPGPGPAQTQR